MKYNLTDEQIACFETEFVEFIKNKDNSLFILHEAINKILAELPQTGILSYENNDGFVRAELTCEDNSVYYSWYTSEDILAYSIAGAISGMFGTKERIAGWAMGIVFGVDIREKFIEMINTCIEIIDEISDYWTICVR